MPANPRNERVATPDVAGLGLSGRTGAPPSAQATTGRQQPSLDRPHASDYGTNPTGAQSEEPDGGAGPTPFPLPEEFAGGFGVAIGRSSGGRGCRVRNEPKCHGC